MPRNITLPKSSRYIPTNNTFSAIFGTPTPGVYDFGSAGNANQAVFTLQPNTVYLVDYFAISGNISSEVFLSIINTQPMLEFHKKSGEIMFTNSIPTVSYTHLTLPTN
jgi:hypothetical protein